MWEKEIKQHFFGQWINGIKKFMLACLVFTYCLHTRIDQWEDENYPQQPIRLRKYKK